MRKPKREGGQPKLINLERPMESTGNHPNADGGTRGHGGLRKARSTEKAKPMRNDRQSRWIQMDQGQFQIKAPAVRSNLGRASLDFGRARWMRRNAERMNGKAKSLSDRNTFFIYDRDERGSGLEEKLEENVRLCSPMSAYVRLIGKKCLRRRMVNAEQSRNVHGKPK